jgi:hypothetical protein
VRLKDMRSMSRYRHIGVLVLLVFTAGSFVFPGRLVVCMRHGQEARVVPAHATQLICTERSATNCGEGAGSRTEIAHKHVPCNDIPLSNPGDIGDRERLPAPGRSYAGPLIAGTARIVSPGTPEPGSQASSVPDFHSPVVSQHIQSVVLII